MIPLGLYAETTFSDFGPLLDPGTAIKGYGNPTSGEYAVANKGWKTFGTLGQGPKQEGVKEIGSNICAPRKMIVTVYAKNDWGSKNAQFTFGSYYWEQSSTGARRLLLAGAAVVFGTLFSL